MVRAKQKPISDAKEYFSEEMKVVMEKHRVETPVECFNYLVDLLLRHIESEQFFTKTAEGKLQENVLAGLYAEYLQAGEEQRKVILQKLGDTSLLVSGFFAESISRKTVDLEYYFGMGGIAYQQLAEMQSSKATRNVYSELSHKFRPFSDILNEMSERSGLQSNSDLLKLYERWLSTKSDRIRQVLGEHGIVTSLTDFKIKH